MRASANLTYDAYILDETLKLAFERSFEIIGEAANNIDVEFRERHPEIPWRLMRGMRNILAHVYWSVSHKIIWDTVKNQIPGLIVALEELLNDA